MSEITEFSVNKCNQPKGALDCLMRVRLNPYMVMDITILVRSPHSNLLYYYYLLLAG